MPPICDKQASLSMNYPQETALSARLYALRLIKQQPELSYELLIICLERIANKVLCDYVPKHMLVFNT